MTLHAQCSQQQQQRRNNAEDDNITPTRTMTRRMTGDRMAAAGSGRCCCRRSRHGPDALAVNQSICRPTSLLVHNDTDAAAFVVLDDDICVPLSTSPMAAIVHVAAVVVVPGNRRS